ALVAGDRRRCEAGGIRTRTRAEAGARRGGRKALMLYLFIEYLHVLGAVVILGTGAGIAFFMLMAHRTKEAAFIAKTAEVVVIADMVFPLSAVLLQPVTGALLMWLSSTAITERWLMASLVLYAVAGAFWVPVVLMQVEMRDLARVAAASGAPLPSRYGAL